jgi:hypothetical protein
MGQHPILVFQMGKVGSTTVVKSLEQALPDTTIHQPHFLHDLDGIEKAIRNSWFNSPAQMAHLDYCRSIRKEIDASEPSRRWKVVTLVRDPIGKAVSAFFYNIDLSKAKRGFRWFRKDKVIRELVNRFMDTVDFKDGSGWFDDQLKPVFGVDVFAEPFPVEQGYHIYETANSDVLLLKIEHLDRCAAEAFGNFLGLENFTLADTNRAEDTSYAAIYGAFKDKLNLPPQLLDEVYSSRLPRQFYSEQEIRTFRRRWGAV